MISLTNEELNKCIDVLNELHKNPECSGEGERTKSIIRSFIESNTSLEVNSFSDGLYVFYKPEVLRDKSICFRADFDAVVIPEGGASHLCGHDGHTATLLGIALLIDRIKPDREILLIFQPSEENGKGAIQMKPLLERFNIDSIYGCHNLPGFEFGKVFSSDKTFSCASSGMTISFSGKPAHAAYPEFGISPSFAVADLIKGIEDITNNKPFGKLTFATIIGCNMGQKAFGTAAENAEIWITLRSDSNVGFKALDDYLCKRAEDLSKEYKLSYSISREDIFPATENESTSVKYLMDRLDIKFLDEPMRWSEDFGVYLESTKGAFFGIGAGNISPLHTKEYVYPSDLLKYQIETFIKLL